MVQRREAQHGATARKVRHPVTRSKRSLPIYPTASEIPLLLSACEHERDRRLLKLIWWTGGRISEVLQVRAGDLTKHGLRLTNLKQRQTREKHVFLPAACMSQLREWTAGMGPSQIIVGRLSDGERLTRERAWQIVTTVSKRAGIYKKHPNGDVRPLSPHKFRHGNAVHQIEAGLPINVVSAQLGHADLSSTTVYLTLADPHRQELVSRVTF